MMRIVFVLAFALVLPAVAAADTSVQNARPPLAREECDFERGPFATGSRDQAIAKLAEKLKMSFVAQTARHILFSRRWWTNDHGSTVVDRASGRVIARIAGDAAALVEDAAGDVVGLLALDEKRHEVALLDPATGAPRWRHTVEHLWDDRAAVVADGERLIIAVWPGISSGSRLFALSRTTGAAAWTADVAQLNVPHSEYYNDVTLALAGDVVTLRGMEAGGCYLQTFDARTGARRSSQLSHKW
jgi:outer membrane protein assembly factor BamB